MFRVFSLPLPSPTHQMHFAKWAFHLVHSNHHPRLRCDTEKLPLPVEHGHGNPLWSSILSSSRESDGYREALSALLSSDHDQKLLYKLSDHSAIEGMLNVLDLVSVAHAHSLRAC